MKGSLVSEKKDWYCSHWGEKKEVNISLFSLPEGFLLLVSRRATRLDMGCMNCRFSM